MKNIYKHDFLKWSNLFFLIPLIIGIFYNLYWYSMILFVVFIVSYDFHLFNETKNIYYLDVIFSSTLMISNLVLLFMGYSSFPYNFLAVGSALIALVFYFRRSKHDYYLNHSFWHVFSAMVCVFCLASFIF